MSPNAALQSGRWVKLICGAGNQDLVAIEDLCALYTAAGVHCIDIAADTGVAEAARRGINWALARGAQRPWLMVSLSDGADPHFRKASFDPSRCPSNWPQALSKGLPGLGHCGPRWRPDRTLLRLWPLPARLPLGTD